MELHDNDSPILDEIVKIVKKHANMEYIIPSSQSILSFPGIEIHLAQHKVYRNHEEIHLTAKEYAIFLFLAKRPHQVLTYQQIYEHCWGELAYGNEKNVVGSHVRLIRRKLKMDNKCTIRCIWEIGYRFDIKE